MFSLNARDFFKGLLLAVLVPVLTIILQSLEAGVLTFNWVAIGTTAISALLAYLVKNFLTDDVKAAEKTLAEADAKKA